jgi:hypothetical protein
MIRHIVMWKLHDEAAGNDKMTNAKKIKVLLESLIYPIPDIGHLEVGINAEGTPENNWDVVLVSDFPNLEALDAYQVHPAHQQAAAFIKQVVSSRSCVDYVL